MATILLIIIYLAFIGLGLPDSLFGTAWPAIYTQYGLPFSMGSIVSIIVTCGTITASILSARVIARFGTGKVTAVSTAMTAAALLGFSLSGSFLPLCLLAVPLGLGAGAIDSGLNNYVAIHYNATQMNLLHCFYGIGVTISPYLMSRLLATSAGWRGGYQAASLIQIGIALVLVFTLPLWRKVSEKVAAEEIPAKVLSLKELAKIPGVKNMWVLFFCSCGIENVTNCWGSTFLVEHKALTADQAAQIMIFYFVGFTLGRLISGVFASKFSCWKLIRTGMMVMGIGMALLLLPLPSFMVGIALFLIGMGNSPLFPNFTYLAPRNFGEDISQSVIGSQMAASNTGFLVTPLLCSLLGQFLGMGVFPIYLALLFVSLAFGVANIQKTMKAAGKDTL